MAERFRIEALSTDHDRTQFVSGSQALDRYFETQVSQDMKRRLHRNDVAIRPKPANDGFGGGGQLGMTV